MYVKPLGRALVAGLFILAVTLPGIGHWADVHGELAPGCDDAYAHFCPDSTPHDTGPCAICRAAAGGLALELTHEAALAPVAAPLACPGESPALAPDLLLSRAPRAPPAV